MIAPTFESLSTRYSKPNRIAFAKVDVDSQQAIAQQYGVRAMPTFLILHNGSVINTIQGADPPALTAAVDKAVKLAGGAAPGAAFATTGRTLGGGGTAPARQAGTPRQGLSRPVAWDLNSLVNAIITFFGLYFSSLFSVSHSLGQPSRRPCSDHAPQLDPYMAAQNSKYNIHNPTGPAARPTNGGPGGQKTGGGTKTSFRTLSDLGGE